MSRELLRRRDGRGCGGERAHVDHVAGEATEVLEWESGAVSVEIEAEGRVGVRHRTYWKTVANHDAAPLPLR